MRKASDTTRELGRWARAGNARQRAPAALRASLARAITQRRFNIIKCTQSVSQQQQHHQNQASSRLGKFRRLHRATVCGGGGAQA